MSSQKSTSDFRHKMPQDLASVLHSHKDVAKKWEQLTPLAKNEWICYVTIVKKAETRKEHLERLCGDLLGGEKRPCCWPGCPHRRPGAARWFHEKNTKPK